MKDPLIPTATGRNDGEEHVARRRKESLKALRERENREQKANEKTRRLREARLARENGAENEKTSG